MSQRIQVMRHPHTPRTDDVISISPNVVGDEYASIQYLSASLHLSLDQARLLVEDLQAALAEQPEAVEA